MHDTRNCPRTAHPASVDLTGVRPPGGVRSPASAPGPAAGVLDLAGRLAAAGSLTHHVEVTLPALAALCGATVVVFAVAGSRAAGARCWPADPDWAATVGRTMGWAWEDGPLTRRLREVGVVPAARVTEFAEGWGTAPGLVLEHRGRVLGELLVVPVARTGSTVASYLAARYERPFDDEEVARARAVQPALVASHGRFLRTPDPALTPRQTEVLRLLAEGRTVGAVATRLGVSPSTVDKHVRDLYQRLGTQDRASTIRAAQLRGLLDGLVGEHWQDLLVAGPS